MKLHQILSNLQKLHPKEIDLSLKRINKLCSKLGNPQENLKCISVIGTNGKYSTIQVLRSILKEEGIKTNIYTSPHIQKINERYVFNDEEISDENLKKLLMEVSEINNNDQITYFEFLTAAFFYKAKTFKENINIIEAGLFHRFDATNILKSNLASVITPIGLDHLDWLPKKNQNIDKVIFEKTSSLLNSKIIISKQSSNEVLKKIETTIEKNQSTKIFFGKEYNYSISENCFFYYEDKFGGMKLPLPNVSGKFQLSNIATAIATIREVINNNISLENIKTGISKIKSIARLQEIKNGKIKELVKKNKIIVDGSHNPLGAMVLNDFLNEIHGRKHIILGMMKNKDHIQYVNILKKNYFSLTTVDIPNQPNSIKGSDLKKKLSNFNNVTYKKTINEAIQSLDLKEKDIIIITGSLYLAGEVLNQN